MPRTKLKNRTLPDYTKAEEIFNMVSHIVGGGLAFVGLILCVVRAALHNNMVGVVTGAVYGFCMLCMFTISGVYHGLHPSTGKKVLQVIDHCDIYFMIAGSYTPLMLCCLRPLYPGIGWGLFIAEWVLTAVAVTLTAIDLKQYSIFSYICYILMGWGIILFAKQAYVALTPSGFWLVLSGGIAYTIGAVLYAIGSKARWFHSIFHIFVLIGSILHFFAIFFYAM